MTAAVRTAEARDDEALRRLDRITWSPIVQPGPPVPDGDPFFTDERPHEEVLVAVVENQVVGYARLGHPFPLESGRHVLEVQGLAVDPAFAGRGVGRLLVEAAITEARRRGARKLSLRVLGGNARARSLYERCGFEVEGILREEFFLEGQFVDDILMAIRLEPADPTEGSA